MILAAGPLDVNPIAMILLQPLFLLMSTLGGTAGVLVRTRTSQVSHSSPSATPLSRLPHLRVVPVWGLAVVHRLGALGAAWSTYESHRKSLYVESLMAGTHEVHGRTQGKFLLITHCTCEWLLYFAKKNVPPADRSDPPAISSHARKCLLITHQKMNTPC